MDSGLPGCEEERRVLRLTCKNNKCFMENNESKTLRVSASHNLAKPGIKRCRGLARQSSCGGHAHAGAKQHHHLAKVSSAQGETVQTRLLPAGGNQQAREALGGSRRLAPQWSLCGRGHVRVFIWTFCFADVPGCPSMYHHSEGYPNAPQHSSTEGRPAPLLCFYFSNGPDAVNPPPAVTGSPLAVALASGLSKESLNKLNSWKRSSPQRNRKQSFPSR